MNKLEIKKCVLDIIDTLCDRNGFDDWWDHLDDEIEEIVLGPSFSVIVVEIEISEFPIGSFS